MNRLKIIKPSYIEIYKKRQPITLLKHFNKIKKKVSTSPDFGYTVAMSSVYSSMIEGNRIDPDTYLKYTDSGMNTKSKSYKEIQNLKDAYIIAKRKALNKSNFLESHNIMSIDTIEDNHYRGKVRDKEVGIFARGEKIYSGASKKTVEKEFNLLFDDIAILRKRDLTMSEVFYFASMIHLVFVKIHPFADCNGRAARLLEKWFLSDKLGNDAWYINSEKLYQSRLKSYYSNLDIGVTYETVNYDLSLPFLKMLPMALRIK